MLRLNRTSRRSGGCADEMTADDWRVSPITGGRGGYSPTLAELEQAELEARERRAAAKVDAECHLEAARVEARAIEGDAARRIADAVEKVRARVGEQASEEVAAIEHAIEELETESAGSLSAEATQRFERMVKRIVAAVLLESEEP